MRSKFIWLTAWKEILSTWRDWRTFSAAVFLPLLIVPLTVLGLPLLIGGLYGGEQTTVQVIGVKGLEHIPAELKKQLESSQGKVAGVKLIPSENPLQEVQNGKFDVALEVPAPLPEQAGTQGEIKSYARLNSLKTLSGAAAKVKEAVNAYNQKLANQKLQSLGLTMKDLQPVQLSEIDAARAEEKASGQFAFIIPLLIITYILQGGQPTAIDATAGEKERGTLEVLLVSPVRRMEVLTGKLLATFLFSMMTATSSMVGLGLTSVINGMPWMVQMKESATDIFQAFGGSLALSVPSFLVLLLVALSVAVFLSILQLAITLYARSFKEAQTYLIPLSLVVMLASVALQFSDFFQVSQLLYYIPLANAALVILDIVKGKLPVLAVVITVVTNLLYGLVLFFMAHRTFNREQVIFRN